MSRSKFSTTSKYLKILLIFIIILVGWLLILKKEIVLFNEDILTDVVVSIEPTDDEILNNEQLCLNDKLQDKSHIIWNNESDCDDWKFSNANDKIFTRDQAIHILSNTTIIFVGISVDRRLGWTFHYWLFDHPPRHFHREVIHYNDFFRVNKRGKSLRMKDGDELNNTVEFNGLVMHSKFHKTMNDTYNTLVSMELRSLIHNELKHQRKVILFIPISLPTLNIYFAFNYTLMDPRLIRCNREIRKQEYLIISKKRFDKCWQSNIANDSLIFNKFIEDEIYKVLESVNQYYNLDDDNFRIVFRSFMPKTMKEWKWHPYTDNVEGYYVVNKYVYHWLCSKLKINIKKWKFINMYELFLNKTSHDRLNCFGMERGGYHLQDYGRYVYAQKFLNTLVQFDQFVN